VTAAIKINISNVQTAINLIALQYCGGKIGEQNPADKRGSEPKLASVLAATCIAQHIKILGPSSPSPAINGREFVDQGLLAVRGVFARCRSYWTKFELALDAPAHPLVSAKGPGCRAFPPP
jgi:hypothetical protein